MKFAAFFMGEYIAILAISGIMATCFLGGYLAPINWSPIQALGEGGGVWGVLAAITGALAPPFWLVAKVFGLVFVFIWVRATLLRLRYDQLMNLGWRFLIPAGLVNLTLTVVYVVAGWMPALVGYGVVGALYFATVGKRKPERREVRLVSEAQPYRPKEA